MSVLNLNHTGITILPESIGQLSNLQALDLWGSEITCLPESIEQLANLRTLDISLTQITTLPESIGQLTNLQSLNLGGTRITALPESFGLLTNLQELNLCNTLITALPDSVFQLKKNGNWTFMVLRSKQCRNPFGISVIWRDWIFEIHELPLRQSLRKHHAGFTHCRSAELESPFSHSLSAKLKA